MKHKQFEDLLKQVKEVQLFTHYRDGYWIKITKIELRDLVYMTDDENYIVTDPQIEFNFDFSAEVLWVSRI